MAEYIEREARQEITVLIPQAEELKYLVGVLSKEILNCKVADRIAELSRELSRKGVDIPAADVAPVRHGRWVEWWPDENALILTGEEMLYCCTACDAKFNSKENMRYCSNCGAKMDGEAERSD